MGALFIGYLGFGLFWTALIMLLDGRVPEDTLHNKLGLFLLNVLIWPLTVYMFATMWWEGEL